MKCDGTRTETRFRLSAKRASPFKSAGASVQSTTGSRAVRISDSNAGYIMFRGSVKGRPTGYPIHSPVSPALPLPCVTMYHHVSTGLYNREELGKGCEMCLHHNGAETHTTKQSTTVFTGVPICRFGGLFDHHVHRTLTVPGFLLWRYVKCKWQTACAQCREELRVSIGEGSATNTGT